MAEPVQDDDGGHTARRTSADLEGTEIELLLEAIHRIYGFDFRDYALASLRRRIWGFIREKGLATVSGLQEKLLHDRDAMERFLLNLSITVTAMFRDPGFHAVFREKVVPYLKTCPFIRIWHVGCATGEEPYSMAILLAEEGLYDRARLYATDMNETVLVRAREGIFPLSSMREYTQNYLGAGGQAAFSDYYTARYDHAILHKSLKRNIVFAHHNLVTDGSFNEFNAILCRNVMIYFNPRLQQRAHELMFTSLRRFGVLALGRKEILHGATPHEKDYEELDAREKIYRRVG